MVPFLVIPLTVIGLLQSNNSARQIAIGACYGVLLGLLPLNCMMMFFLIILFFIFKLNRSAALLVFPFFKLFYVLGLAHMADYLGGLLLIDATFLKGFWYFLVHLPVICYLGINNTLVAGGFFLSFIIGIPVYAVTTRIVLAYRGRYYEKVQRSAFMKWYKHLAIVRWAERVKNLKDHLG